MVKFARSNFLVPVPEAASWEALNAELRRRCQADLGRRLRGKEEAKGELLAAERPSLRPLPANAFEARRIELGQANSLSLVRFDGNDYSVPTAHEHQPNTVEGGHYEGSPQSRDQLCRRPLRRQQRGDSNYSQLPA